MSWTASPVFAPVGRFVASQERGRVRIAAPEIWNVFARFSVRRKRSRRNWWGRKRPASITSARSASSFGAFSEGS